MTSLGLVALGLLAAAYQPGLNTDAVAVAIRLQATTMESYKEGEREDSQVVMTTWVTA